MGRTSTTFKKGQGGKPKGALNKTTKDIKEAFQMLIEKNLDNLTGWLETIAAKDPEKAIRIINDLSEYVIPKLARTDVTSGDKPINFRYDLSKLSEKDKKALIEISEKLGDD